MIPHKHLLEIVKVLPTDYSPWGKVEKWQNEQRYPDCSCSCKHFVPLKDGLGFDWGVCTKINSPRAGLLTFEHQAGFDCHEPEDDE